MRSVHIKINPFELTEVLECKIKKSVNHHMEALDEKENPYPIFRGILSKLKRIEEGRTTKLEISAKSKTVVLEEKACKRFFQNKNQTYKEITNYVAKKNSKKVSIIYSDACNQECELVAQYEETDWGFLKRLASQLNTVLVPDCTTNDVCFYFGLPQKKQEEMEINTFEIHNTNEIIEYVVTSRDVLELCTPVQLKGGIVYVCKIDSVFSGDEFIHTYYLRTKQGFKQETYANERISGVSFIGEVKAVRREKIKIECQWDCNVNQSETVWFNYATVYSNSNGTGWFCMPETGDRVRLQFPDSMEPHAYGISAIHMDAETDLRKRTEIKSFRTSCDKEIRFSPDRIVITNHKGISIILDDEAGVIIESSKDIKINARGGVEIKSGEQTSIVAQTGILFKENNNSLSISDGIRHSGLTIEYQ